jgi:hypothetical protein
MKVVELYKEVVEGSKWKMTKKVNGS